MTLKPGAPGTRTAYTDLGRALMDQNIPNRRLGAEEPALLLYRWCLQSHNILNDDEKAIFFDALTTLFNLMDDETRTPYLEECSRVRRRDALQDAPPLTDPRD